MTTESAVIATLVYPIIVSTVSAYWKFGYQLGYILLVTSAVCANIHTIRRLLAGYVKMDLALLHTYGSPDCSRYLNYNIFILNSQYKCNVLRRRIYKFCDYAERDQSSA